MSEVSLREWTDFLSNAPEAHLLQTGEWGELKAAFGWETVRLRAGALGAQILFRRLPLGQTFGYLPKGPVGRATDDDARALWDEMESACRRRNAIFLKIEPDLMGGEAGDRRAEGAMARVAGERLRASPHSIQPQRTVIVDLRGTEQEILGRMKPKCRYNIGLAGRKGVGVRPWDNIPAFHAMMQVTGNRDGFAVHSVEYVRRAYELFRTPGMAELLVAEHSNQPLAALMVFRRGARAWYLYGASTDESRELMPNYLLQWEAMRWAMRGGAVEYDLWGVPDEDEAKLEAEFENRHDGLWGVYRFKRGFGGEVLRAGQAVDRVYQPVLYGLYRQFAAGRSIA